VSVGAAARRLEVLEVFTTPDAALRGCYLGVPEPGERIDPRALVLRGWVLAEQAPAAAVEVVHQGVAVARAPVELPRPEIGVANGDLSYAANCGFESELNLAAATGEVRLEVRAVLDPLRRAPIATLSARLQPAAEAESVTVVIPCFKQAHFLAEAIGSVLAQSHPRLELIVIDDGSPDNVGEVAARYPGVRCLRQPNAGLAAARNAGLARATGDFVIFLDADDRLAPEAVERGIEELRAEPEAMMAAGTWRLIGEGGEPVPADPPRQPAEAYSALLESCFISTPAVVLYRRELFAQVGNFDASVSASADYDLYLRAADRFPVRLHDHVVADYRRHGANMTRDPELILRSEVAVLERQRSRVVDRPELEEALERGLARSRAYHGERIERLGGDDRGAVRGRRRG
jgi:hypothetical protein